MLVTGHGWGVDVQNCLEFCPQSHVFEVEGCGQVSVDLSEAGVRGACALHVDEGVVPNQFGQWTSGRSNWCVCLRSLLHRTRALTWMCVRAGAQVGR